MMKKIVRWIITVIAIVAIALPTLAAAMPPAQLVPPKNVVEIDFSLDPDTGEFSVIGLGPDQLRALGIMPFDPRYVPVPPELKSAELSVDGQYINSFINNQPLLTVDWDNLNRRTAMSMLLALSSSYGESVNIDFNDDQAARIEQWISNSKFTVTGRVNKSGKSYPLVLKVTDPIKVDLTSGGDILVEEFPIPGEVPPQLVELLELLAKEENLVCYKEGTLEVQVDGNELPSITLHPEGLDLIKEFSVLNMEGSDLDPLFDATLGVDFALDGSHSGKDCSD
jgi:hypothetical protein